MSVVEVLIQKVLTTTDVQSALVAIPAKQVHLAGLAAHKSEILILEAPPGQFVQCPLVCMYAGTKKEKWGIRGLYKYFKLLSINAGDSIIVSRGEDFLLHLQLQKLSSSPQPPYGTQRQAGHDRRGLEPRSNPRLEALERRARSSCTSPVSSQAASRRVAAYARRSMAVAADGGEYYSDWGSDDSSQVSLDFEYDSDDMLSVSIKRGGKLERTLSVPSRNQQSEVSDADDSAMGRTAEGTRPHSSASMRLDQDRTVVTGKNGSKRGLKTSSKYSLARPRLFDHISYFSDNVPKYRTAQKSESHSRKRAGINSTDKVIRTLTYDRPMDQDADFTGVVSDTDVDISLHIPPNLHDLTNHNLRAATYGNTHVSKVTDASSSILPSTPSTPPAPHRGEPQQLEELSSQISHLQHQLVETAQLMKDLRDGDRAVPQGAPIVFGKDAAPPAPNSSPSITSPPPVPRTPTKTAQVRGEAVTQSRGSAPSAGAGADARQSFLKDNPGFADAFADGPFRDTIMSAYGIGSRRTKRSGATQDKSAASVANKSGKGTGSKGPARGSSARALPVAVNYRTLGESGSTIYDRTVNHHKHLADIPEHNVTGTVVGTRKPPLPSYGTKRDEMGHSIAEQMRKSNMLRSSSVDGAGGSGKGGVNRAAKGGSQSTAVPWKRVASQIKGNQLQTMGGRARQASLQPRWNSNTKQTPLSFDPRRSMSLLDKVSPREDMGPRSMSIPRKQRHGHSNSRSVDWTETEGLRGTRHVVGQSSSRAVEGRRAGDVSKLVTQPARLSTVGQGKLGEDDELFMMSTPPMHAKYGHSSDGFGAAGTASTAAMEHAQLPQVVEGSVKKPVVPALALPVALTPGSGQNRQVGGQEVNTQVANAFESAAPAKNVLSSQIQEQLSVVASGNTQAPITPGATRAPPSIPTPVSTGSAQYYTGPGDTLALDTQDTKDTDFVVPPRASQQLDQSASMRSAQQQNIPVSTPMDNPRALHSPGPEISVVSSGATSSQPATTTVQPAAVQRARVQPTTAKSITPIPNGVLVNKANSSAPDSAAAVNTGVSNPRSDSSGEGDLWRSAAATLASGGPSITHTQTTTTDNRTLPAPAGSSQSEQQANLPPASTKGVLYHTRKKFKKLLGQKSSKSKADTNAGPASDVPLVRTTGASARPTTTAMATAPANRGWLQRTIASPTATNTTAGSVGRSSGAPGSGAEAGAKVQVGEGGQNALSVALQSALNKPVMAGITPLEPQQPLKIMAQ